MPIRNWRYVGKTPRYAGAVFTVENNDSTYGLSFGVRGRFEQLRHAHNWFGPARKLTSGAAGRRTPIRCGSLALEHMLYARFVSKISIPYGTSHR